MSDPRIGFPDTALDRPRRGVWPYVLIVAVAVATCLTLAVFIAPRVW